MALHDPCGPEPMVDVAIPMGEVLIDEVTTGAPGRMCSFVHSLQCESILGHQTNPHANAFIRTTPG